MELKGRDLIEGIPKTLTVTDAEIREALQEPVAIIVNAVRVALERTPPELSADIVDRGIVLTGGGACSRTWTAAARGDGLARGRWPRIRCARWCWGQGRCCSDFDLLRKISLE